MQTLRGCLSWLANILIVGQLFSWCWDLFRTRGTPAKIALGCILLLIILCLCSLPFVFLEPI